jgi:hypothetical protein
MQAFLPLEDDLLNMAAATHDVTNKSAAHNAHLLLYFEPPTAGIVIVFCFDNFEFFSNLFLLGYRIFIVGYTDCSSNGLIYNNIERSVSLFLPWMHNLKIRTSITWAPLCGRIINIFFIFIWLYSHTSSILDFAGFERFCCNIITF